MLFYGCIILNLCVYMYECVCAIAIKKEQPSQHKYKSWLVTCMCSMTVFRDFRLKLKFAEIYLNLFYNAYFLLFVFKNSVQLTLEQYRFDLLRCTYTQTLFSSNCYSTVGSSVGWICWCGTAVYKTMYMELKSLSCVLLFETPTAHGIVQARYWSR